MNKVYIISRFRADSKKQIRFNQSVARFFCRKIIDEGKSPVAPHIYYTQFLDDLYPDDRKIGCNFGLAALRNSQEFLLVIIDGVISKGMKREIAEVSRLGIPGRIVSMTHKEISEAMKVIR